MTRTTLLQKIGNPGKNRVYLFFIKLAGLSILTGGVLEVLHTWLVRFILPDHLLSALLVCCIMGGVFVILMLVMGRLFKIEEIRIFFTRLLMRIWPWPRH